MVCPSLISNLLAAFDKRWLLPELLTVLAVSMASAQVGAPPKARRDDVVDNPHGVRIPDPYRWLEDRHSPETQAWLEAENKYTDAVLARVPGLKPIEDRLAQLMDVDSYSIPMQRGGRFFFTRRLAGQSLPSICMREGLHGPDQVLLDPSKLDPTGSTSADIEGVSEDGLLLIYGLRQGGQDQVTEHIRNVATGQDLPDQLPRARYFGLAFTRDRQAIYYARMQPEGPGVFLHKLGTDPQSDVKIFGNGYGPDIIIVTRASEDGKYLLIEALHGSAADKSEVYIKDLENHGPITPIVNDLSARFYASFGGDTLFLHTNWDAPNSRVLAVDLHHPARDQWKQIVPESDAVIEAISTAGGKLFVNYLRDVHTQLVAFSTGGQRLGDIPLPAIGSAGGPYGLWKSPQAFFSFTSFHVPARIYSYDTASGTEEIWAEPKVPIHASQIEVQQVWYTSKDGTRVPMFLVYPKGLKRDGSHAALMTGYGGFNVSYTPAFSAVALLWVERGGVFALPNLRGGGEFGEKWHRAGMFGNKQSVFDDFIAAAECLVRNGYTSPQRLAATGRSNGGLLMGAMMTQQPDLFHAIVCGYPLLDMLRYQDFLVARFWVSEYGSAENPEQFRYLLKYSPYQNVKPGTHYPAVLFVTGDGDTRVDPLHARKMTALMQASQGGDLPILLHYDMRAGHTTAVPISQQIRDAARDLHFLLWQTGAKLDGAGK
jgi:prolyl oligopeptidase